MMEGVESKKYTTKFGNKVNFCIRAGSMTARKKACMFYCTSSSSLVDVTIYPRNAIGIYLGSAGDGHTLLLIIHQEFGSCHLAQT